jgi:hypothetical protein
VLHRDLKSDNALIQGTAPLVVKWADFGCSVKLDVGDSTYGDGTRVCVSSFLIVSLFSRVFLARCRRARVHGSEGAHGMASTGNVRQSSSG